MTSNSIKVSKFITFAAPVTQDVYAAEFEQRKVMLDYYTNDPAGRDAVHHGNRLFDALKAQHAARILTSNAATVFAVGHGGAKLRVLNMQADQSDGFKLKLVKEVVGGKPVFTDNKDEAARVDGVFFFDDGVVIRVFTGFVPSLKASRTQVTVELLNSKIPEGGLTQEFVDDNVRGLSAYAFKLNGQEITPAGMWPQYGVDPANKQELERVMSEAHLAIQAE